MRARDVITLVRDLGCYGLALWGIWHQAYTGKAEPMLLAMYAVMLGLPALVASSSLSGPAVQSSDPPPSANGTRPVNLQHPGRGDGDTTGGRSRSPRSRR